MGEATHQRILSTLNPLFVLLSVATIILLFSLVGIFTRPPNLLAAFWPANAVLLGIMLRYPPLASPPGWLGGLIGYLLAALFTQDPPLRALYLAKHNGRNRVEQHRVEAPNGQPGEAAASPDAEPHAP